MKIAAPKMDADHPDRHLNCQEAIERSFQDLVDAAMSAGWDEPESVAAIIALAENHMLAKAENDGLNEALRELIGKRQCGPGEPL